jgi:methylamine dehydrogenase heavy chain
LKRYSRALGCFVTAACLASSAWSEQQFETLSVAKLPAPNAHRIYLSDISISHIVDNRLHVIDGDSFKYLGVFATGYAGQSTLSRDRRELYVTTSYYTRLSRGERTDVVEIHDPLTLEYRSEIVIPPRRAQALPYEGIVRTSSDGRWLFVQNATPATSVTVVNLKARKFAAEIPNPGCWIVIPSETAANRFSTLCGDGTLQTLVLNEDGSLKARTKSARFFDPDEDPVYVQTAYIGDRHYMVSFRGKVHVADLSEETARLEAPWSLLGKGDMKQGWRPGGYQLFAIHRDSHRMFIAMHKRGTEGTHKNPADEIWVVDLVGRKRIGRLPGHGAVALAVSQTPAPKLFALDGIKMGIASFDAGAKPRFLKRMEQAAESATQLELH